MNLIEGRLVSQEELINILAYKTNLFERPLDQNTLFEVLSKMHFELFNKKEIYHSLVQDLQSRGDISAEEIQLSMQGLIDFISIDNLRLKLKRELGSEFPFELKRVSMRESNFEAWYPLGVLAHVTPNNSALLSVLGLIEGLLSGNVNILKLGRKDSDFSVIFFKKLMELDSSDQLRHFVVIARISSKEKDLLKKFLNFADVISAWGNEESIRSIKEMVHPSVRIVEWGHKISFSYITKKSVNAGTFYDQLSFEICNNEQQACSSPQCIFVEDASFDDLKKIGNNLAESLKKVSPTIKRIDPVGAEVYELTVAKEQVRLESYFSEAMLIDGGEFRIFIDMKAGIESSPLFRTIWLKPMPKNKIIENLRPMRQYLQTVGLAVLKDEVEEYTRIFFNSGVQRIRSIGTMVDSYMGEPHDGVWALSRFCQRISMSLPEVTENRAGIIFEKEKSIKSNSKIMTKADFQNAKVEDKYSDLFFHSGGSSGEPKLSIFTYADYHRQMEMAAHGLMAAGLNPATDRCMNLFYAGNLYGGFVSFFTILEKLEAVQFPMGASTEFEHVADTIIKKNVDTILGMPSYIMQLFSKNADKLKKYKGIKKVFFGGEHMSLKQKEYLIKEFGVHFVRSASYGSVDAGPLGYQCEHCTGGIHHLHEQLHSIEVVGLEDDKHVKEGEVGRFLFTSKVRHGQQIVRYEIGDVGKLINGKCECGRTGVRFELLGRSGDVFRIGTIFLSYQKFQKCLIDQFEFEGSFQVQLFGGEVNQKEKVLLLLEKNNQSLDSITIKNTLIEKYQELNEVVIQDKVLDFEVQIVESEKMIHNKNTGKLKSVVDTRISL